MSRSQRSGVDSEQDSWVRSVKKMANMPKYPAICRAADETEDKILEGDSVPALNTERHVAMIAEVQSTTEADEREVL